MLTLEPSVKHHYLFWFISLLQSSFMKKAQIKDEEDLLKLE